MKHLLYISLFLIGAAGSIQAQKFGYLNSTQLLLSMPEIKAADAELKKYQDDLIGKGESMVRTFESAYQEYLGSVNAGELSQMQMQQAEAKLAQDQKAIQDYEVEVQNLLTVKKRELYQPVLDKVQAVVDQVGKENGYTMIFDASIVGILYAVEADDLMSVVKQKLGIQ